MVRVLHVLGSTGLGGAESRIMDLYRGIDRDKVQFDFLVHMDAKKYAEAILAGKKPEELRTAEFYDEEIRALGGNIYAVPRFRIVNLCSYKKALKRFFEEHHDYSVVQGHMTSTASIYLPIAKRAGIKVCAAHARSAGVDAGLKGKVTSFLRRNLWKKADYLFTCSELAGKAVFGEHETIYIPNAIRLELFRRDDAVRAKIREQYGIPQDATVIGHMGRFHYAKNHEFLIRVYHEIIKERPDIYLLLVGDGVLRGKVFEQAKELGLNEHIIFTGNQKDPQNYYMAMDFFLFPSRYEGLPGTVVEAQASGLHCLISDSICKEASCSKLVETESLQKDEATWARRVLDLIGKGTEPVDVMDDLVRAGFDAGTTAKVMERFYLDPTKENLPRF